MVVVVSGTHSAALGWVYQMQEQTGSERLPLLWQVEGEQGPREDKPCQCMWAGRTRGSLLQPTEQMWQETRVAAQCPFSLPSLQNLDFPWGSSIAC